MGNRGFNAGGFAYMPRVRCHHCGRQYVTGNHNLSRCCVKCCRNGLPDVWVSEEQHKAECDAYFALRRLKKTLLG